MKKGDYTDVKANEWVFPKMKKYRMACCDCGLVHTVDFKVYLAKPAKKGYFSYITGRPPKGMTLRVSMKANRDNVETERLRKLRHIRIEDKK